MVRRLGALRLVGWASAVACVFCITQFLVLRPLAGLWTLAPQVWTLSVINASACTVVPVVLVMKTVVVARVRTPMCNIDERRYLELAHMLHVAPASKE
jgi:hypothetical protein